MTKERAAFLWKVAAGPSGAFRPFVSNHFCVAAALSFVIPSEAEGSAVYGLFMEMF
jgi:uncharacterized protein (DUF2062 family)